MKNVRLLPALAALVLVLPALTQAQQVDASRGADPSVDYAALKRIGPWDDRNYALTAADLALLAPNEAELSEAIPAFYRVQLRRRYPDLLRTGKAQYPRSALPRFMLEYRGYLFNGKYFRKVRRNADGRWSVNTSEPVAMVAENGEVVSLEGEVRVTNPTGAAESSIEVSPIDDNILVAGSNGPGAGQKMHFSFDGGQSWNESAPLPLGGTCCDPTIGWSSDGQYVYTATLGNQNYFYRSADNGVTWADLANEPGGDPRREISAGGFVDKEYLHVDRSPASPFQDNIYLTWHESNIMRFARSRDFGNTWDPVISFSNANAKRGIGSDIATDRAGNIYYVWAAFNSRDILVSKSTNGGTSFAPDSKVADTFASFIFPVPSMETREVFVYAAVDTDQTDGPYADSVYVSWTDSDGITNNNPSANHARIQVAYSRNGGNSWTVVTPHPTADIKSVDRWHQWLAVGPDGTVHLIYYNTLGDPSRTSVNVYHAFSTDGGQTWSQEAPLTTVSSPNINDGFEFGDYNGLAATLDSVIAIFTDNRNELGGGGRSVDVYAAGKALGDSPVYTLADTAPGQAGVNNDWTTTNGTPNGFNVIYFGAGTGTTPVSVGPCSVDVGLANARPIGVGSADATGTATASRVLPGGIAGRTFSFQALDIGSCTLSNTTQTTF
jgi:hypothetical protein